MTSSRNDPIELLMHLLWFEEVTSRERSGRFVGRSVGDLRFLCITDVYRPDMYSVFKCLIPKYQGMVSLQVIFLVAKSSSSYW